MVHGSGGCPMKWLIAVLLGTSVLAQQATGPVAVSFETMTVGATAVAFAPATLGAVAITSSSVANPSVITTSANHQLSTGQTVTIAGHTGSTPAINGSRVVTVLTATTFTIPLNVTVGGTGGTVLGPEGSSQVKPNFCEGVVETNAIRYRADGTNPTASVGVPLVANDRIAVRGYRVILNLRLIRQSADATIHWQCYRE